MLKLSSKKLCRGISFKLIGGSKGSSNSSICDHKKGSSSSSSYSSSSSSNSSSSASYMNGEIKWEVRPGGMLVQKRQSNITDDHDITTTGELITLRVSTVSQSHDISIEATSTFGELKMVLEMVTKLEPREQRVLFKGKEREDSEYLHMVGVRDKDKLLVLEDPAIMEEKNQNKLRRLHALSSSSSSFCTITV